MHHGPVQRKRRRVCAGGVFFDIIICFIDETLIFYDKDGGIFGSREAKICAL
jgi:hypothetical protein